VTESLACLHVVAGLHPADGGPSRTVVQLADALSEVEGIQVTLLSQGRTGEPQCVSKSRRVVRQSCESGSRLALRLGLPVRQALAQLGRPPKIIHSHGVWLPVNHWSAGAARRLNVPLVIQPRGMLEPWALEFHGARKRLAMILFQRRDLDDATALVATSRDECKNFRRLGLEQPVAVIPNGIDLRVPDRLGPDRRQADGLRTALFLSRVHPKKGLIPLVQAWGRLRPAGWRLRIAGPDEGGHLADVLAEARRVAIDTDIEYIGSIDDDDKSDLYLDTDLFVLPTYSENFGVVVVEALAHGVPVITTRGAPWPELISHGCGWWIDVGMEPLFDALRTATQLADPERRAMGERGRALARRYDWTRIGRQTADFYHWLLGMAPQPDFVALD